jgi:choline dehydrogenase-like flavoprotein
MAPEASIPKRSFCGAHKNVAVVDASRIPTIVPAHPVGTIMAVADRAADILAAGWS